MIQAAIPAVFMRGGTSKGVFFHDRDLPADRCARDRIFRSVLGSPDPYERQLDGLGGGISSLSKAVVIAPSARAGIDVDYTFAQIDVATDLVDYGATCGNLSSAVGPFAIDEGLVPAGGPEALVRVHNTNTGKAFEARFAVRDGRAEVDGDFAIAGVAGAGARVRLDFLDPGGAATDGLLPTGAVLDRVGVPEIGPLALSMVDATTPCVFVAADAVGLRGDELPDAIDDDPALGRRLERIRAAAGVRMGLGASQTEISTRSKAAPKIAVVAPPATMPRIDGGATAAAEIDLSVRMISMGRCHKAVPLTGAMCLAAAARIEGSIVHQMLGPAVNAGNTARGEIRIGTPSGVLPIGAEVCRDGDRWTVERLIVYRTARRLMEGRVLVPPGLACQSG